MPSGTQFSTFTPEKQASILNNFCDLFRGNERGYGVGEFRDARQREEDSKWTPGHVRWVWGQPSPEQFAAHLRGELLTGVGVLCDDGRCWFACLDIDEYGDDIDYNREMNKIRATKLPLIVFRTKSGGLRIVIFFARSIEATQVIPRMRKLAAMLGYSGCEIFPKQTKLLVENNDCPSWIYLPYGGTGDNKFAEQGAMNDGGNLMEIEEALNYCLKRRLQPDDFMYLFGMEDAADKNGKRASKKHPDRIWVQEDSKEDTLDAMFWDGPVCLRILSRKGVGQGQQNYFLSHCATFLLKKYENWDQALTWVNMNVLMPVGDMKKLENIIKRWPNQKYEYQCHEEPMRTYCDAHGCRSKKYGVGADGVGYPELGMTKIDRNPAIFIISVGDNRLEMSAAELMNPRALQIKYLEHGLPVPVPRKQEEHRKWINEQIASATVVPPKHMMRSNAYELEILAEWFGRQIPIWIRKGHPDDTGDVVRVKDDEQRIYFKWKKLVQWIRRTSKESDVTLVRSFINKMGEEHGRDSGGHWWRSTYSVPFGLFEEEDVERWLNPE